MSELKRIRKDLQDALTIMRCSSDVPLSSVKTVAECAIRLVRVLEKKFSPYIDRKTG